MLLFLMNFDRMTLPHLHAAFKTQHADTAPPRVALSAQSFLLRNKRDLPSKEKSVSLYYNYMKLRFKFIFKKYLDDLQV